MTLLALACAALLSACRRQGAPQAAEPARSTPQARISELVDSLTPLDKTVTSDISDQRFIRSRELLGQLRNSGREVGLEALRVLGETRLDGSRRAVDVERGLLDVAAYAAPEDARPLLHSLVSEYGASLDLRTEAVVLYAQTSPEQARQVVEPMVTKARPNQTAPPAEFLVQAYVIACEKTAHSPVKVLADVATNLFQDEAARIRAVKELSKHDDLLATQALQAILVESTGDGYLRRMAAQGIRAQMPRESACGIFQRVAEHEADMNFAKFMADMLDKNCQ